MSDENIESILKIYLKDDIKCHVSEFRHCIQEHLYERFHKLENDVEAYTKSSMTLRVMMKARKTIKESYNIC